MKKNRLGRWLFGVFSFLFKKRLTQLVDQTESNVRKWVAAEIDGRLSGLADPLPNVTSGLEKAFAVEGIPKDLVGLAESVGVMEGDIDAIQFFKKCAYKGSEPPTQSIVRENWIGQQRYANFPQIRLMTEELRRLVLDMSFYWKQRSPVFRGGLKQLRRYVIGKGVVSTVNVPEIDKLWQQFLLDNKWEKRQKTLFEYGSICGELTLVVRKRPDGKWWAGVVPYFEQDFPDAVLVDPEDRDCVIGVGRRKPTGRGGAQDEYYYRIGTEEFGGSATTSNNEPVQFTDDQHAVYMIFYGEADEIRGRPTFHSALKPVKIFDDFITNRARINDFRTRIMLKKTLSEGQGRVDGRKVEPLPPGGVILTESKNVTYTWDSPRIDATDAYSDGKLFMYYLCASMETPPHIAMQNAENSNLASIREAGVPFVQVVLDWQDDWKEFKDSLFQVMLAVWIKEGEVKGTYAVKSKDENGVEKVEQVKGEDAKLICVFPEIVKEDVRDRVEETKTLMDKGVMSVKTASTRHGLEYANEQAEIDKDRKKQTEYDADKLQKYGLVPDDIPQVKKSKNPEKTASS